MKRSVHLSRGPARASEEVRREIELHLDLRADEFKAQGMNDADARQAAIDAFGDRQEIESEVSVLRYDTLQQRAHRDRFDELAQDLRITLRGLRRAPGFTVAALLTLALGIGANSAIFSVVRSVLLRPLPYTHSEELVQLWSDHRSRGLATPEWLSPPDFMDWQTGNRAFSSMAAYQGWNPDLTGSGEPESLTGFATSWNFFNTLGVSPASGRGFTEADDRENAEKVVILADGLWRRRFGADASVIGRPIILSGESWTVIGVMPKDFRAPVAGDVWRPMRRAATSNCDRGCVVLQAIGRLKPGVTLAQAKADLDGISARDAVEYPRTNKGVTSWPIGLHEQIVGPTRAALEVLSGAVLLVLLIGCVNLASLLLLRGAAREREMSVRASLGAGRGRLLRQLLTESMVLAVAGGFLGLLIGWWGSRLLGVVVPANVRAVQEAHLDGTVVVFTAGLSLFAGVAFGLVPALQTARADLMTALRTSTRGSTAQGHVLRRTLVVAELALAVTLLIGAGLLAKSFLKLARVDLGFRTDSIVSATVFFPAARYADASLAAAAIDRLVTGLRLQPSVRSAAVVDVTPLVRGGDQDASAVPIGEPLPNGRPFDIWYRTVTPSFMQLVGMRLVGGRAFTAQDRGGAVPVGIVNESAAHLMWPGKSPLGRQLTLGGKQLTIVGVVANALYHGPNQPIRSEIYAPLLQFPTRFVTVMVDPKSNVAAAVTALKETLHTVDPNVPLGSVRTMSDLAGTALALPKVYALIVVVFATAALGLAVLGVYSVMAFVVAQRQREIGVRLALGATPHSIQRLILGEGGRLAAIGIGVGLLGAALIGRALSKLLFQTGALDGLTYVGVAGLLGTMSLVACWLPARRAMGVDPLVAMRNE